MKSMINRHLRPCVVLGLLAILVTPLTAKPPGGKGGGGGGGEDPPSPPTPEISYSIQFLDTLGGTDTEPQGQNALPGQSRLCQFWRAGHPACRGLHRYL